MSSNRKFWEGVDIMMMNDPNWQPTTVLGTLIKQPVDYASSSYTARKGSGSAVRSYNGTDTNSGGSIRSGSHSSSGGSAIDEFIGGVLAMGMWFVEHLWPLKVLKNAALWLADSSRIWKLNAPVALVGAFFLLGMTTGPEAAWFGVGAFATDIAGGYAPLLLFGVGAVAGWFTLPTFGVALAICILFIGVGIGLALIAGVAYVGWHLLMGSSGAA